MTVWGVAIRIERGLPVIEAVEVTGSGGALTSRTALLHRCESTDRARALMLLANDMEHELSKAAPAAIVVKGMDWHRERREKVARPRLQAEGVVLSSARRFVPTVASMSGKEVADGRGQSKAEAEEEAGRLFPGVNADAAIAALGALLLAESGS